MSIVGTVMPASSASVSRPLDALLTEVRELATGRAVRGLVEPILGSTAFAFGAGLILLALAQARQASGAAFVAAYVAGVELETRIANGVHFHHYEKGWHPTSTLGVFGCQPFS